MVHNIVHCKLEARSLYGHLVTSARAATEGVKTDDIIKTSSNKTSSVLVSLLLLLLLLSLSFFDKFF